MIRALRKVDANAGGQKSKMLNFCNNFNQSWHWRVPNFGSIFSRALPFSELLAFTTFCREQNGRQKIVKSRSSENVQARGKMDPKFEVPKLCVWQFCWITLAWIMTSIRDSFLAKCLYKRWLMASNQTTAWVGGSKTVDTKSFDTTGPDKSWRKCWRSKVKKCSNFATTLISFDV